MNRVLSFVALDFRLIKPYVKSILFLLILGIGMGFGFKSVTTLSTFFMMSLVLVLPYPFTISEKNGLDMLYSTLSLNRTTVVKGRYLFALALGVLYVVTTFLCSVVLARIIGAEFIVGETATVLCVLSSVFFVIVALQYPIYFKYGYTKARFLALGPMFIVFLGVIMVPTIASLFNHDFSWESVLLNLPENPLLVCVIAVVVGLVILGLSCVLSGRVYEKKDI